MNKIKSVVFYPEIKGVLNFTDSKFREFYQEYPEIDWVYADTKVAFYQEIKDADYIFSLGFEKDVYIHANKLKAVFSCMAGKESIPRSENKIIRYYNGSFHGHLMIQSLIGVMLYFNQQISTMTKNKSQKEWSGHDQFGKRKMLNRQSIAIIGYGSIGRIFAKTLSLFGMKIYAVQRSISSGYCEVSGAEYVSIKKLNTIISDVDHVVSVLPKTPDTDRIFNAGFFASMNRGACFYNFGRGNSVVEKDLIESLESKNIVSAALDVFHDEPLSRNSKLWETDNLLIMPHISAFYENYIDMHLEELHTQFRTELLK